MATDPDLIRLMELYLRSPFYRRVPIATGRRLSPTSVRFPPYEMLCGAPDPGGFAEWQPVDSPVDEALVAGFERFLDCTLPQLFKSFLMFKCFIDTDLHFAILPKLDPRHPLGWLEWNVKESRLPNIRATPWYVPFAPARAEMGVMCFDTRRPDPDGDYPIVLAVDTSAELSASRPEYVQLHESYKSYLRFICDSLEYMSGTHYNTQSLAEWLAGHGRPVPDEVRYYQP